MYMMCKKFTKTSEFREKNRFKKINYSQIVWIKRKEKK